MSGAAVWWRGTRGEWFVVVQVVLIALVFLGPRTLGASSTWPFPLPGVNQVLGVVLMLAGGAMLLAGILSLGKRLTPLPFPKEGSELVQSGAYRIVRHPMYSGGLGLAVGWALVVQGWLTLVYALCLFAVLVAKSRREERWLAAKFPAYAAYRQRVRALIPFVY